MVGGTFKNQHAFCATTELGHERITLAKMSVSQLLPLVHDFLVSSGFTSTAERLKKECGVAIAARSGASLTTVYSSYLVYVADTQ